MSPKIHVISGTLEVQIEAGWHIISGAPYKKHTCMVVNIRCVDFLLPSFMDFTPAFLDLGRLAVGRSDLTRACETESVHLHVCDTVNVI